LAEREEFIYVYHGVVLTDDDEDDGEQNGGQGSSHRAPTTTTTGKTKRGPFPSPLQRERRSKERRGQGDLGTAAEVATRRGGGGVARMGGGGDDGES
jgi:hypothetical protein